MLQAFIIVLREGFESFLIVAITLTYLAKTQQKNLIPAVFWGAGISILSSAALGFALLQGANEALWEGIFGLISAVLIALLVIHMWRTAAHLKRDMENKLSAATGGKPRAKAFWGVLLFTVFMISREGMETALLLIQIHQAQIIAGIILGIAAAAAMALVWIRFSYLVNLKRFFQATSIFLLLFVAQILLYSFHELTEAGLFPNSEFLHEATELFSHDGLYGKWISIATIAVCALWPLATWAVTKLSNISNHNLAEIK